MTRKRRPQRRAATPPQYLPPAANPQLAARMFETLAEQDINLLAISASEIKVSALVAESELELAVRVLHSAFGLDAAA